MRPLALLVLLAAPAAWAGERPALEELVGEPDGERDFLVHEGFLSEAERRADATGESLLVYSATRSPQPIEEAPAIVTVITREELRAWGYRSVDEALAHVVGFYVLDDHVLPNVGVRGSSGGLRAESGILKVMIDGRSGAFRSTSGNWLGPELVPLSAVERIEVIRGPASALYGADAFLGVVNVITRARLARADVTADYTRSGAAPGFGADAAAGGQLGPVDVLAAARFQREDRSGLALPPSSPDPTLPADEADLLADGLLQDGAVGLLKLQWAPTKGVGLSLAGHVAWLERGAEFADWAQLAGSRVALWKASVDLGATVTLSEQLELAFAAMTFAGGPTSRDHLEVGSDVYSVRREFGYRGADLEAQTRYRPVPELQLVLGASLVYDDEDLPSVLHVLKQDAGGLSAGDVREQTSTRQGRTQLVNPGALLQAHWKPLPRLGVTGGVRYDHHNIYGSQVSGRLGCAWSPAARLHLKALYGGAFKAPSPVQLFGVPLVPGDVIGNRALEPQFVHTFEGQVSFAPRDFLHLSTGLAYNLLVDQAELTRQGINTVARNISEAAVLSWESEAVLRYRRVARAYANLAVLPYAARKPGEPGYQSRLVGRDQPLYPDTIVNAGALGVVPGLPLRLGIEGSWVRPRRASDSNVLEHGAPYELGPVFLLGGTIATHGLELVRGRATDLRLIGRNLLDRRGADPGFTGFDYPLRARLIMLQVSQEI